MKLISLRALVEFANWYQAGGKRLESLGFFRFELQMFELAYGHSCSLRSQAEAVRPLRFGLEEGSLRLARQVTGGWGKGPQPK